MTEKAQAIIEQFHQSALDYASDVVNRAESEVEILERDSDVSAEDFQQILYGLLSPLYALSRESKRVKSAIDTLNEDGESGGVWKAFYNKKPSVRRQMEDAYAKAVGIVENAAIRYVVSRYEFVSDVDDIPKEFRDEVFRKAWATTKQLKGSAKLSSIMDAFRDMLDVVDSAWLRA